MIEVKLGKEVPFCGAPADTRRDSRKCQRGEAKARFKTAWLAFKDKHGPEKLAEAYAEMNHANRADRYRR